MGRARSTQAIEKKTVSASPSARPTGLSAPWIGWTATCIPFLRPAQSLGSAGEEGHLIHQGDIVCFHVADIFLPAREELSQAIATVEDLEGIVMDFSDSGPLTRFFAVINVISGESVIVPVDKLQIHQ